MHPHFISYLGFYSSEEYRIHNGLALHVAHPILSMSCLLMPSRCVSCFFSVQVTRLFYWAVLDGAALDPSAYPSPADDDVVTSFVTNGFTTTTYSGSTYRDVSESFGLYLNASVVYEEDWASFQTVLKTWWTANYDKKSKSVNWQIYPL